MGAPPKENHFSFAKDPDSTRLGGRRDDARRIPRRSGRLHPGPHDRETASSITRPKRPNIMTTKSKTNYPAQIAADQSLIAGLTKHAATLTSLLIAGASVLTTDFVTTLQARIAAIQAAIAAHAAFTAAVAAAHAEIARTAALVSGARQALKIAFAGQPTTLGDFGLMPPKVRTPLSTEEKAAAVAKAQATRAARHTMGSKQKAKVTGSSPAPAPASASTSAAAQPVPAATAATPSPAVPAVQGPAVTPKS